MLEGLSIGFFGSSLVSTYWNGAATYYRGIIRELHRRGHRIRFFEPDAFARQQHRDMADPAWCEVVVYPATEDGVGEALERARGLDLVVKASGVGVFDDWLEREVLSLRREGTAVVFWDVDASATLSRLEDDPNDPFHALIPCYDLILSYGGGPPVVNAYRRLGAVDCVPIYNALDPDTHHPVEPQPRFQGALGFLGNRLPDREARVTEFFFKAAGLLPDETFLLGGNGWDDLADRHPNVRTLGHVGSNDHNAFNCSPRAVLNINRASMAATGYSPPTRVFEAVGAGACLLCDYWPGLELFLEPGREVLVVDSGEAVAETLASLDPAQARALGEAGRQRLLREHTYRQRGDILERVFQGRLMRTSHV
jgi:spore maturation protein CgeB